jgi:hypothetical protein
MSGSEVDDLGPRIDSGIILDSQNGLTIVVDGHEVNIQNVIDKIEEFVPIVQNAADHIGGIAEDVADFVSDVSLGISDFLEDVLDTINDIGDFIANGLEDLWCWFSDLFGGSDTDPIVLNLNGVDVETTLVGANGIKFDMNGDGIKEETGWVTNGNAFLVVDKNKNGIVDSRAEMFSDILASDSGSSSGALLKFDSNGDGIISAADIGWAAISVWIPNEDATGGELLSLDQLGIVSMEVFDVENTNIDSGNKLKQNIHFQYADGTVGKGAEVDLRLLSHSDNFFSPDQTTASLIEYMLS